MSSVFQLGRTNLVEPGEVEPYIGDDSEVDEKIHFSWLALVLDVNVAMSWSCIELTWSPMSERAARGLLAPDRLQLVCKPEYDRLFI